jgi:cell division protease FtsH
VTIIPRGLALGYVLSRPEDDRHMRSKGELESDIKVGLGGTMAEEIVYNEICTGAVGDLNMVNSTARKMVKMYGMSRLGRIFYPDQSGSQFLGASLPFEGPREFSEETAREIDLEVRKIVEDAIIEVRTILQDRRSALDALAKLLMEKETIDGKELREILDAHYPGPKLVPASTAITSMERPLEEQSDDERESRSV